jgi:type II secretory pathway pseudopilin PulG
MKRPRALPRRKQAAGFSMMELLLVMGIIIILSLAAVPNFRQIVEETRVERAVGELDSLWLNQRLHYLQTGRFALTVEELNDAKLLPAGAKGATGGYDFKVRLDSGGLHKLQAVRDGGSGWHGQIELNQRGHLGGKITNGSGDEVKP